MATLPNPQMMADAQALNIFAQAVSQAAVQLVNHTDPTDPGYPALKQYFLDNLPKLQATINRLAQDFS